jgi:serine/threonine protein kinase HipA of HipAB toxin-antitoxin module
MKNYSIVTDEKNRNRLAPAYDIASSTLYGLSRLMGFKLGDALDLDSVTSDSLLLFADDLQLDHSELRLLARELANRFEASLHKQAARLRDEGHNDAEKIAEQILKDAAPRLEVLGSV